MNRTRRPNRGPRAARGAGGGVAANVAGVVIVLVEGVAMACGPAGPGSSPTTSVSPTDLRTGDDDDDLDDDDESDPRHADADGPRQPHLGLLRRVHRAGVIAGGQL